MNVRILLGTFDESSVFRIDHYLGKRPVHNMVFSSIRDEKVKVLKAVATLDASSIMRGQQICGEPRGHEPAIRPIPRTSADMPARERRQGRAGEREPVRLEDS